ncbi:MAG: serine protease [Candidatus Bathyarchaeia archaeon]|jgi:hypothetical protein
MVYRTLQHTKDATYAVCPPHPIPAWKGFPYPAGTGFFISPDGYFITARHVVEMLELVNSRLVPKLDAGLKPTLVPATSIWLQKPEGELIQNLTLVHDWPKFDMVLLKADFDKVKGQRRFEKKTHFDYLEVELEIIPEGYDVYSFGYPLSDPQVQGIGGPVMIGIVNWFPRATSAIISSHHNVIGMIYGAGPSPYYVIDKALNPGNSGGPIVVNENGRVISVCTAISTFQLTGQAQVKLPTNYTVTTAIRNVYKELKDLGIVG